MTPTYLCCLPVALLLASCAQDTLTGDTYSRGDTRQSQSVQLGYVTAVEPVKIEGGNQAGSLLGAVAGGFLGHEIGSGSTANTAGAIGGALVGGAAGGHIQQAVQSRQGLRISVKLDSSGKTVAVVQEANPREVFRIKDRVSVQGSGSRSRVVHSSAPPPRPKTKATASGSGSGRSAKPAPGTSKPEASNPAPAENDSGVISY